MDQIFIWIIILFAIILILDYSDKLFKSKKSNEHFTDAPDNYTSGNIDVNEKNNNVVCSISCIKFDCMSYSSWGG